MGEAGVMSEPVLNALAHHAKGAAIESSCKSGCGKSTLLLSLSWLSRIHTVFALEKYGEAACLSYERVLCSELLNRDSVSFVLGPTQLTLPNHRFETPVQLALIDGPHGFPFPFLEYYYFYPVLEHDGLLIVDDIHIPTIRWLHDFLIEDEMFRHVETVENTSFFRRTAHPMFNPYGDDWWLQNYNANRFNSRGSSNTGKFSRQVDRSKMILKRLLSRNR